MSRTGRPGAALLPGALQWPAESGTNSAQERLSLVCPARRLRPVTKLSKALAGAEGELTFPSSLGVCSLPKSQPIVAFLFLSVGSTQARLSEHFHPVYPEIDFSLLYQSPPDPNI